MSEISKEELISEIPKDPKEMSIELELADQNFRGKPAWNIKYKPTGELIGFFMYKEHDGIGERIFFPAPGKCFNFTILVNIVDLFLGLQTSDIEKGGN